MEHPARVAAEFRDLARGAGVAQPGVAQPASAERRQR